MTERRTHRQVARDTVLQERTGILGLANKRCRMIDLTVSRGRMNPDEAETIKRALRTFAGDIAIGLHVEGNDDPEIRVAMRPVVKAQADG
jgi:hypothetical protein